MTYTLAAPGLPGQSGVIRDADGSYIPASSGNADWQTYLAWVAAGNTANPYVAPVVAPPTVISAVAFLGRFTQAEQLAVQQAAITNPVIALGLTMGLAQGTINLDGPLLGPWMQGLVGAGCITAARMTVILTP
jgi:hypothetical protein